MQPLHLATVTFLPALRLQPLLLTVQFHIYCSCLPSKILCKSELPVNWWVYYRVFKLSQGSELSHSLICYSNKHWFYCSYFSFPGPLCVIRLASQSAGSWHLESAPSSGGVSQAFLLSVFWTSESRVLELEVFVSQLPSLCHSWCNLCMQHSRALCNRQILS